MSDLPVPKASRLQKPAWRDSRLVVGLLLVLASVLLGSYVVAHADDRTAMYAAAAPLVPGHKLTEGDLSKFESAVAGVKGVMVVRRIDDSVGLWINKFAEREIIGLREAVEENARQGYRFDKLIPAIKRRGARTRRVRRR